MKKFSKFKSSSSRHAKMKAYVGAGIRFVAYVINSPRVPLACRFYGLHSVLRFGTLDHLTLIKWASD